MKALRLFALVALFPAAFGPAAASANPLLVALCTGDGQHRVIAIPLKPALPGSTGMCCAKGCHGSSRKRSACDKCLE